MDTGPLPSGEGIPVATSPLYDEDEEDDDEEDEDEEEEEDDEEEDEEEDEDEPEPELAEPPSLPVLPPLLFSVPLLPFVEE